MRKFFIVIHRYVGLLLVPFLIIVSLTGSVLAFYQELDRWLNPALLTVSIPESTYKTPLHDLFILHEQIEQQHPHARIDWLGLHYDADEVYRFFLVPRISSATGKPFELSNNEIYFNPYTGEQTGARTWGEVSLAKENIMSFLYRLHYTLALPEHIAVFGVYVLGIAALLWFLDCFVGFYLTLPLNKKQSQPSRSILQNWKPAWQIKLSRFNYDLHRASGLWLWPILFVIAWSGVAFNLKDVYHPVMSSIFNMRDVDALPKLVKPIEIPELDMRAAHQRGQQIIQAAATHYGFKVASEQFLTLDREHGVYLYRVKTDQDLGKYGATVAIFDAHTGTFKSLTLPASDSAGDVIDRWITELHTARVFGLPMQILICITGLIVVILSVTGAIIWLKKKTVRKTRFDKKVIVASTTL